MSEIIDDVLSLSQIVRLSPLNPRQETDTDVSMLAATIRAMGNIIPMLVRQSPNEETYEVLDGGRRWRAMRSLEQPPEYVAVKVFHGPDAQAREAAIVAAVTPKPLHPVQEYEAFSALANDGFSIAKIAEDFDKTEKQVRQSLKLGRLSCRVRALWMQGEITRTLAEAFTCGAIEAQDAYLDSMPSDRWTISSIRKTLRSETVEPHEALAKFILGEPARLASYELLGGRVEEDDFFDRPGLLDRAIAQNYVDGYLLAAAEEIMAQEGWGRAEIAGGADPNPIPIEPDYTKAEERRIDAIREECRDCADGDRRLALDKEAEEIDRRAFLRAIPKKSRATLGVRAELDGNGNVEIIRAVPQAEPEVELEEEEIAEPAVSRKDAKAKTRERDEPEPPAIPPAPGGKEAEEIIRDAIGEGLARATARNPYLALALATAALGSSHGCIGVGLRTTFDDPPEPPSHDLLQRLEPSHFLTALAIVAETPLADLSAAFAELISRTICFSDVKIGQTRNFTTLAQRMGAARNDIAEALDYKALFAALSREDALDAIRAIDGEAAAAEASKLRKPKIVERAAILAADRKWLPETLATLFAAGPEDTRSTAQAMVEAIEADKRELDDDAASEVFDARLAARESEETESAAAESAAARNWAREVETACIATRGLHIMSRFLIERCYPSAGATSYAVADFRSDLEDFGRAINPDFHIDAHEQDAVLFDLGVTSKRKAKSGYVLQGLAQGLQLASKTRDAAE